MNVTLRGTSVVVTTVDLSRLSGDAALAARHFGALMDRFHTALTDHALSADEIRGIQAEGAATVVAIGELMQGLELEKERAA